MQAEVSRRSRSASREKDAMAAHVKRFSPGTTAGGAEQNLTEAKSNSRGANVSAGVASPGYIENLYERGKQKVSDGLSCSSNERCCSLQYWVQAYLECRLWYDFYVRMW